ncbi:MAG TPA: Sua5/YciO/YrdC/YwlC family protein [Solirubrobacteraceae bacterium]|nr:Sua5/YciO/YrdC/YwlC family protein [Solirubrobacteraceae bacterium]
MSLTPEDATRLEECLAADGLALIPTDTVYGLACNPESEIAVRRVYELKRRAPLKPSAVMFFTLEPALRALPEVGARTRAAMRVLLPGPVTLLLPNPRRRFPLACEPGGATGRSSDDGGPAILGLRVPLLEGPLAALAAIGVPAAQSSANLSGAPDPRRLGDVPAALREGTDLVLDGGGLPGTASTVIDLSEYERSGRWRIVRDGPLGAHALERLLG